MASPEPASASLFHAGNTCPHCQETIAAGQWIVTCSDCGSAHHENCWSRKQGCSSYHCDKTVSVSAENLRPDITIGDEELSRVRVEAPPVRRTPQEIAAQFAPKAPQRLSRLAIASLALGGGALVGGAGALLGQPQLVTLGIALALGSMTFGVIALVAISNAENRISGFRLAVSSVCVTAVLCITYFICLGAHLQHSFMRHRADSRISETMPTDQDIGRMPPAAANAMRANVVIKYSAGFVEATSYGSGVVTRLSDHTAYILTNKHVIGEGKSGAISVLFHNGEESKGKIHWCAPDADVAIVTCQVLSLNKYQPIQIANELSAPGVKVFAVGNPMGLAWSYTEGAISGLRKTTAGNREMALYQTQTPINSGNSGGGLYTMDGILIGVNTMTEDKSVAEGLNFAIASTGILQLLDKDQRERCFGK
ncbi:MAG TPA: trypsin-like peptidase domain-containing protein [Planctomycetota bacterium]|jgi:S1-C subfamily serine protease